MKYVAAVAVALAASLAQAADGPQFSRSVSVARSGEGLAVSFAASSATDVAVCILDAGGGVIRHLVAGVLGPDAPPPLKAGSLEQSLVWDGKDDEGKPAAGGPFKARVRLGMKPQFDGFLLDNPAATGKVNAVAVGPGGQLYLWHHDNTANGNQGTNKLKVLTRDGRYIRTLMPFPATLDADRLKVLGAFADADGHAVPRVYNLQQLSIYYEASGERGSAMSDSAAPAVDSKGRAYWIITGGRLEAVNADGSPPYDTFLSDPLFADVRFLTGQPTVCVSDDDKSLYAAGIGKADDQWGKNARWLPCVWRIDTTTRKAEVFLGDAEQAGTEKDRFTRPRGLASAKGLLYVADGGADRIAVFKQADRSFVGEISVKNPQSIGVDPATGAVYVCAYTGRGTAELIKFSGWQDGREVCRMKLPKTFESGPQRIAVDASAQPVRIWLPTLGWQSGEIHCIEDAGQAFQAKGDPRALKTPWAAGPRDLTIDRRRGELYVKHGVQRYYRLDVRTGQILADLDLTRVAGNLSSAGTQLAAAPDGSLVTLSWGKTGIRRLDRDGKPLNWPGRETNVIPFGGIMTFQQRCLAVPSIDEMLIMLPPNYRSAAKGQEGGGKYTSINVLAPDGATKRTLVWQCTAGATFRTDARGNIYVADMLKPVGRSYPEFFDDKLGKKYKPTPDGVTGQKFAADAENMGRFWESTMYGSIVKFPPGGGMIWYEKKLPPSVEGEPPAALLDSPKLTFDRHVGYDYRPVEVQGAQWVRFGFSPWAEPRGAGFCMCEGVGFDVDAFGRVFYPNLGQFRIEVVDTANNWIGAFGRYGNQDAGSPDAAGGRSEIPLAWPTYVAVTDDYAFVNDTVSNRVVRVRLDAQAEETSPVP
ncbi:MAG: hypothetical protein BIFFINMI_02509 [Phycisphaerae bacterium]|nr:hypothetical protein [Phycisphaerae bacterium]